MTADDDVGLPAVVGPTLDDMVPLRLIISRLGGPQVTVTLYGPTRLLASFYDEPDIDLTDWWADMVVLGLIYEPARLVDAVAPFAEVEAGRVHVELAAGVLTPTATMALTGGTEVAIEPAELVRLAALGAQKAIADGLAHPTSTENGTVVDEHVVDQLDAG